MYERGEEPKIFLFPKQGNTVPKIEGEFEKVDIIGEVSEDKVKTPKDDDFQIMYDDELKEYVLKRRPLKMDKNGIIDSWNGGDTKEIMDDSDDEVKRILESGEEGLVGKNNRTLKTQQRNHTEVTLEEEEINLEGLLNVSF